MKTLINTMTHTKSKNQRRICKALSEAYKILIPIRPVAGLPNISLIQNKGYALPGR